MRRDEGSDGQSHSRQLHSAVADGATPRGQEVAKSSGCSMTWEVRFSWRSRQGTLVPRRDLWCHDGARLYVQRSPMAAARDVFGFTRHWQPGPRRRELGVPACDFAGVGMGVAGRAWVWSPRLVSTVGERAASRRGPSVPEGSKDMRNHTVFPSSEVEEIPHSSERASTMRRPRPCGSLDSGDFRTGLPPPRSLTETTTVRSERSMERSNPLAAWIKAFVESSETIKDTESRTCSGASAITRATNRLAAPTDPSEAPNLLRAIMVSARSGPEGPLPPVLDARSVSR